MRSNTLTIVISSMLMAAATQAQPAPTDPTSSTPTQTQTQTSGSSTTISQGTDSDTTTTTTGTGTTTTTSTPGTSSPYDADRSHRSDVAAMEQQRWTQADTDRNGSLSQAEMQASMPTTAPNFSRMDTDANGQLSQAEMRAFRMGNAHGQWHQQFIAADADRDGKLSLIECQTGMPALAAEFAVIDVDKDGKLSTQELGAHQRSMHQGTGASIDADQGTSSSTSSKQTTTTTVEENKAGTPDH